MGLGVERLAGARHQPQPRQVELRRHLAAVAHPHPHRGRRGEHDVDAETLAQLPGDIRRGVVRHALTTQHRGADRERAVDDERVTDDPADVRGRPVDVAVLDLVEGAAQIGRADQVAAGGVNHPLRPPGRPRGVEDEQRVLGVHRNRFAVHRPRFLDVVEIVLALGLELDPVVARSRAAAVNDDVFDGVEIAHRLVDGGFERYRLAASVGEVGADHHLGAGVLDAGLERLASHPGIDHRVDRADAGAREHRDDALGNQRHVQHDPVAGCHPEAT